MQNFYLAKTDEAFYTQAVRDEGSYWAVECVGGKPIWQDQVKFVTKDGEEEKVLYGARCLSSPVIDFSNSDLLDVLKIFGMSELKAGTYSFPLPHVYFYKVPKIFWHGVTEKKRLISISLDSSNLVIEDFGSEGGQFIDSDDCATRMAEAMGIYDCVGTFLWSVYVSTRPEVPRLIRRYTMESGRTTVYPIKVTDELLEHWVDLFKETLESL
ncbi:hypothetical protein [Vibrio phage phiKT1019]|nr:hypothetical protein [Vibrio phage phiKT1019]